METCVSYVGIVVHTERQYCANSRSLLEEAFTLAFTLAKELKQNGDVLFLFFEDDRESTSVQIKINYSTKGEIQARMILEWLQKI